MAPVEWTRLEPGSVEHVIAMLLSRENPEAVRVRPSRGDGGIDVFVPDGEGITVYQVKAFSQNLTAGQKRQIVKSLDRVQTYAQARGLNVTRWLLTMPLDPTPENLTWLDEQAAGRPFTTGWRGLSFVDGLAGQYPTVTDYYLGNGKARLEGVLAQLTGLLRSQLVAPPSGIPNAIEEASPLAPTDVTDSLMSLHGTLNAHDPHFRYDFAVDAERPDIPFQPGLVASAQQSDGDRTVTIKVFAHSTASLEERPIPINVTIRPGDDPDLQQALEAFHEYGEPFETPFGTADFNIDLPGGLGGSYTGGRLVVLPVDGEQGHDTRWQLLDADRNVIVEVLTHMQASTRGLTGNTESARGTEVYGAFDIRTRSNYDTERWEITASRRDISGLDPADVLEGLRFLDEFRRPNLIRPAPPRGPVQTNPIPIDAEPEPDPGAQLVLELSNCQYLWIGGFRLRSRWAA